MEMPALHVFAMREVSGNKFAYPAAAMQWNLGHCTVEGGSVNFRPNMRGTLVMLLPVFDVWLTIYMCA